MSTSMCQVIKLFMCSPNAPGATVPSETATASRSMSFMTAAVVDTKNHMVRTASDPALRIVATAPALCPTGATLLQVSGSCYVGLRVTLVSKCL